VGAFVIHNNYEILIINHHYLGDPMVNFRNAVKNIFLSLLLLNSVPLCSIGVEHGFTKETIDAMGAQIVVVGKELLPSLFDGLNKAAPAYGEQMQKAAGVFADKIVEKSPQIIAQIKEAAPNAEGQIKHACDEIVKVVKSAQVVVTSPIKCAAISGIGAATSIAGIALCYKAINTYLQARDDKAGDEQTEDDAQTKEKISMAKKQALAGVALFVLGLIPIFKSDSIVARLG